MQSAMKGVKKHYGEFGELLFFTYKGVKIRRIDFWDYIARRVDWLYRVDGKDDNFLSLTAAKNYIDKIKKVG